MKNEKKEIGEKNDNVTTGPECVHCQSVATCFFFTRAQLGRGKAIPMFRRRKESMGLAQLGQPSGNMRPVRLRLQSPS